MQEDNLTGAVSLKAVQSLIKLELEFNLGRRVVVAIGGSRTLGDPFIRLGELEDRYNLLSY